MNNKLLDKKWLIDLPQLKRKWMCKVCSLRFRYYINLKDHLKEHENLNIYPFETSFNDLKNVKGGKI